MINLSNYITELKSTFPQLAEELPWDITGAAPLIVTKQIKALGSDYNIRENIAIHKDAVVEEHVVLKGPIIIGPNCFVGAHAYLRGGVFIGEKVSIGPGCEVKSSFIFSRSALAHFNFVGDSIIGSQVNMEAGAIIANHYNERKDKVIQIVIDNIVTSTDIEKFGAVVGDQCKIGANAVLSPGTMLPSRTIVKRLELIEQIKN
jgi:NDP-sugar pyrophosphorylase family protein